MDLDIMASVQEHIIGNCLCVLGDAMAMPIALDDQEVPRRVRGSTSRTRAARGMRAPSSLRRRSTRLDAAPRARRWSPSRSTGARSTRPENAMLVDAAKYGDVEIPVFCYEPKLGPPVGACRMCLVEIEGIPKLQTGCSTPVKDGMVVHTQTAARARRRRRRSSSSCSSTTRSTARSATRAASARCRTSRFGWGGGISRFVEPKRHFEKPLALSPADRDRPRALHPLLPLRALQPGGRRGRTSSSSTSAARTRSSARSTATRTSRRSAATSSSCARSAR